MFFYFRSESKAKGDHSHLELLQAVGLLRRGICRGRLSLRGGGGDVWALGVRGSGGHLIRAAAAVNGQRR